MTVVRPRHVAATLAVVLAATLAAGAAQAGGLDIHADADAKDVGLPVYPGAVKKAEKDDDTPGLSFGLWGESFGIKLAVVSYRSTDNVETVAAFYRDALAKYGPVLDCTLNPKKPDITLPPKADSDKKSENDQPVTCDDDTVEAGGRLFKVGTQRLAARVQGPLRWHDGASFELVRVDTHGTDQGLFTWQARARF